MFMNFLLLLGVLAVAASAEHLRQEVPTDNARAARAMKRVMLPNTMKSNHSPAKASSKKAELNHFDGYLVKKTRDNADCSGVPNFVGGRTMGLCETFVDSQGATGSFSLMCGRNKADDKIELLQNVYSSTDCTGTATVMNNVAESHPKCAMDIQNFNETGPTMAAYSCHMASETFPTDKHAFVQGVYTDAACTQLHHWGAHRGEACTLNVEFDSTSDDDDNDDTMLGMNSEYSYISFVGCKNNVIDVMGFSDSSCLRPMFKGKFSAGDDSCMPIGNGWYMRSKCTD